MLRLPLQRGWATARLCSVMSLNAAPFGNTHRGAAQLATEVLLVSNSLTLTVSIHQLEEKMHKPKEDCRKINPRTL